jgi:hypothetical protein
MVCLGSAAHCRHCHVRFVLRDLVGSGSCSPLWVETGLAYRELPNAIWQRKARPNKPRTWYVFGIKMSFPLFRK